MIGLITSLEGSFLDRDRQAWGWGDLFMIRADHKIGGGGLPMIGSDPKISRNLSTMGTSQAWGWGIFPPPR
jgi:hypothetical protein